MRDGTEFKVVPLKQVEDRCGIKNGCLAIRVFVTTSDYDTAMSMFNFF